MAQFMKLYIDTFLNKTERFKLLILIKAMKTNEHIKIKTVIYINI